MKHLNTYITEYIIKKKLDKPIDSEDHYKYFPETKDELIKVIQMLLDKGETDLNCIDTSKITDMSRLFETYENINFNISEWDVSNVKKTSYMFYDCRNFNCDLSKWNVSNVEDMTCMFGNCIKFEGKGLENWDTHNVENIKSTFLDNKNFNADLSKWNISKVKSTLNLFRGCENFSGEWIYKWDVSNVNEMDCMFKGCENFDCDLSDWDVSNVTTMIEMFYYCKKFTGKGLENWNVSKVKNTDDMFDNCIKLKKNPSWYIK